MKKQKSLLEQGNHVLIDEVKKLKERLKEQEEAAEILAKTWEERYEALSKEHEELRGRLDDDSKELVEDEEDADDSIVTHTARLSVVSHSEGAEAVSYSPAISRISS